MFYVYLLRSVTRENWSYIGCCDDLKIRFIRHSKGDVPSTKAYRPHILVYYEAYKNKTDARKREIELKRSAVKKQELLKRVENSLKK
ncbi:MAG: GIY-YIG nuclease family protein [Candidatus Magasanikbacteria bacterium]|nr:GIY-YIG nuclease family protein [Candidatus Magasanikbacteria bacterium]